MSAPRPEGMSEQRVAEIHQRVAKKAGKSDDYNAGYIVGYAAGRRWRAKPKLRRFNWTCTVCHRRGLILSAHGEASPKRLWRAKVSHENQTPRRDHRGACPNPSFILEAAKGDRR